MRASRCLVATVTAATIGVGIGLPASPALANPSQAGGTYLDDNGSVHEGFIEVLTTAGTIRGCNDVRTLVCPGVPLTRGQMASLLSRSFELPAAPRDYFPEDGGVHEDSINRVAHAGIAVGRTDGTFGAGEPVRREQMATFLANALNLPPRHVGPFTDIAGVHGPRINAVADAGITKGCSADDPSLFCPGVAVTRGQAASLLGRARGRTPTEPPPLNSTTSADDWCPAAIRFVQTLSPAEQAQLASYEVWDVGPLRPGRFPGGSLPLQLFTVSPFTDDPVVAAWNPTDGLRLERGDEGDASHAYAVDMKRLDNGWQCPADLPTTEP